MARVFETGDVSYIFKKKKLLFDVENVNFKDSSNFIFPQTLSLSQTQNFFKM